MSTTSTQNSPNARDSMFIAQSDTSKKDRCSSSGSSTAPTDAASTFSRTGLKTAELNNIIGTLDRMEEAEMQGQRFDIDTSKGEELAELAVFAKLERALARRMVGQDATFTRRRPAGNGSKVIAQTA